jgi:hypothetical protein
VKRSIILAFGSLLLLAGCGNQPAKAPASPKWQGAPYHLAFGPPPAKPNPAGLTIPPINYTANPDMLETRANLVLEFDSSVVKSKGAVMNRMVMAPTDISGAQGALPAAYVDKASADLADMLAAYCVKGKVKISVAITRSSIPLNPSEDQINAKRLSDWTPIDLGFKNPHPKC